MIYHAVFAMITLSDQELVYFVGICTPGKEDDLWQEWLVQVHVNLPHIWKHIQLGPETASGRQAVLNAKTRIMPCSPDQIEMGPSLGHMLTVAMRELYSHDHTQS